MHVHMALHPTSTRRTPSRAAMARWSCRHPCSPAGPSTTSLFALTYYACIFGRSHAQNVNVTQWNASDYRWRLDLAFGDNTSENAIAAQAVQDGSACATCSAFTQAHVQLCPLRLGAARLHPGHLPRAGQHHRLSQALQGCIGYVGTLCWRRHVFLRGRCVACRVVSSRVVAWCGPRDAVIIFVHISRLPSPIAHLKPSSLSSLCDRGCQASGAVQRACMSSHPRGDLCHLPHRCRCV